MYSQQDPEYAYGQYPERRQHQQLNQVQPQRQHQQIPAYQGHYSQYPQQPLPQNLVPLNGSSSLQGALQSNQPLAHSRSSSYSNIPTHDQSAPSSAYIGRDYGPANGHTQPINQSAYRTNSQPFTFGTVPQMPTVESSVTAGALLTTSPDPLRQTFAPPLQSNVAISGPSSTKRQRSETHEEPYYDHDADELQHDKNDQKAKPIRACARCKTLKVKCEVKNEGDPCKRCLNGGHDCVIPGRKIRRVPPKREHLISQIQSQAKEIERLMKLLESGNTVKVEDDSHPTSTLSSPVLSPSSLHTKSVYGPDSHTRGDDPSSPATKKAIEEWIAKTRENMQELAFICVSGGGVPESYIVEEDPDHACSSGDENFVEASDHLDGESDGEDTYNVAIENPDGEPASYREGGSSRKVRYRSSASSMGTTKSATTGRKKTSCADGKPANLPVEASPFGLFGHLTLKSRPRSRGPSECDEDDEEEEKGSGIANENFFRSTPAPETLVKETKTASHQVPAILAQGLITPAEAEKLFQLYFAEINISVSLLDPVLYDAKRTFWRSPFLFTVICAIASRFYPERPELYQQAFHYAQLAAGSALISGTKNVEMCAAYILMSLYPMPVKRWEQQRSWLYLGLAIRTATDLNLHLPMTAKPQNENHAREMLNRTRIWLNCFNLDRSTGSQYGKPPIIGNHDYTANHSENWWQSSPHNLQHFDIHICAYNSELRLMSGFIQKIYSDPHHPTGLNKDVDFERIATETDDELKKLQQKWFTILQTTDLNEPENRFRTGLLSLAYSYARLIALSYGFQHAFGKTDGQDENPFLLRCLHAASDVVHAVVDEICVPTQRHYWRHGPDAQSVFVTFASAFLVKLLQPKFATYLTHQMRVEIRSLVQKVIDLLSAPDIAVDDRHGPKLYAKFLKNLLAKPLARIDPAPGSAENATPPRARSKPVKTPSGGEYSTPPTSAGSHARFPSASGSVFHAPSPATSGSLSPPPAESLTDFNNFRPVGGIDPYAPDAPIMNAYDMGAGGGDYAMGSDFFQPALPFDQDIIRSFTDLADPSGWQDISMPAGFNFMTQFHHNLGIDLQSLSNDMQMNYFSGQGHH